MVTVQCAVSGDVNMKSDHGQGSVNTTDNDPLTDTK